MSGEPNDDTESSLSRRTFMKAAGVTAGAAAVGVGATGSAAADFDNEGRLLNWRTVEAEKVWNRGYRGRRDRTVALTDSGVEARHPDLGPFNGATVEIRQNELALPTGELTVSKLEGSDGTAEGTLPAGGPGPASTQNTHPFTSPEAAGKVEATLDGSPEGPGGNPPDNELFLEKKTGEDEWTRVAGSTTFGSDESLESFIEGDQRYRFVVQSYINVAYDYQVSYGFFEVDSASLTGTDAREAIFEGDDRAGTEGVTGELTPETPKVVGWYDESSRYGSYDEPRDPFAHGTHVAGIMTGTGAGSVLDRSNMETDTPRTVLAPGDAVEYEVEAEAGTNVYACAFGDNIQVYIIGPEGRELHESLLRGDKTLVDEPTVDERHGPDGTATYTVQVRPWEGESATEGEAPAEPQEGTPTAGRLNEIAVGTYKHADETVGARKPTDEAVVHPGIAPNQSLVGMQGLFTGTLARQAESFAEMLNLRVVNMSWGPIQGLPLGTAGQFYVSDVKDIAEGGILTVASAGNATTPANQGGPAVADEAISVVATGPLDGISSYSSGGIAAADEDGGTHGKPDVTAPGGDIQYDQLVSSAEIAAQDGLFIAGAPVTDVPYSSPLPGPDEWIRSTLAGDADEPEAGQDIRDYVNYPGTSMSSPYVSGVASLVAEAMDVEYGDAPESIRLPMPEETGLDDVLRLKHVILSTASETAFTAAPHHNAKTSPHQPTYDFGDRDPYEGYGRVNPDAAVDAVTRDLLPGLEDAADIAAKENADSATVAETYDETLGLKVPIDSRAVAGYVDVRGGTLDVSVDFTRYSGGNRGMAKGDPHVDLFVYDAETPGAHGEPNIVERAQGATGSASISLDIDRRDTRGEDPNTRTFMIVAKLVNVPGSFNGFDVRAHLDLSVEYTRPDGAPLPDFSADGTRSDDGDAFTAGQTNRVEVTLQSVPDALPDDAVIRIEDRCPWSVDTGYGDARSHENGVVTLGTTTAKAVRGSESGVSRAYFAEAPDSTGQYGFGPARAVVTTDVSDTFSDGSAEFTGTDTNTVVGVSTEP